MSILIADPRFGQQSTWKPLHTEAVSLLFLLIFTTLGVLRAFVA